MIKALLFDFDGTLLNTNELIIQTFMHVLEEKFPRQYSPQDCLQFIGPSLKDTFDAITPGETEQMIAKYRAFNIANHDTLVTHYDGVEEVLTQLHADGIRLAIVSSKSNGGIVRGLRVLGIEHLFEVLIGVDDVVHPKPHPEPILLALEKLGIEKHEAMMIGDNSHDIEGGHNAGVKTAGVAWSIKGEEFLKQFKPHYMLQHMEDLYSIVKGTC